MYKVIADTNSINIQSQVLNNKLDVKKFISTILFNHNDLNINDFKIKDLKNNKTFKIKFNK
jgi:rRNA-processing protein FCF1